MTRTAGCAFITLGSLAIAASLALAGCDSDEEGVRDSDRPATQTVVETTKVDGMRVRDGDCIDSTMPGDIDVDSAAIVSCAGTWQYRALNSFDVPDADAYPGETFFRLRAEESCDRRYSHVLFPDHASWYLGHRTVHCLQDNFGMADVDPGKLDRLVDFTSLTAGECFNEAPEAGGSMVELVDCARDWELRVLNSFEVAEPSRYPGEWVFEELAFDNCDRKYGRFRYPSRESWESGDRTVTCLEMN